MPRLSLWKSEKTNDYRFIDRTISEMFTVGATDLYIHKYIGTNNPANSQDATLPNYTTTEVTNIQDLLFLENRDRKYDSNIYRLRGHYNVQNLDFDLSQFGLFLTNDIIFVTVHYNDMIDVIGRKLMVGDVFELPHLTDYHPLNETIPIGLRRYYQVTDANFASEGFSQTWWPHLWRIKCEPLVDSQEFNNILNQPIAKDNYLGDWNSTSSYSPGYTVTYGDKIYTPIQQVPPGVLPTDPAYWQESEELNLRDIIGRYNKNLEINDATLAEAANQVPESGYDVSELYVVPTYEDGESAPSVNLIISDNVLDVTFGLTVEKYTSPLFKKSGFGIRIPKNSDYALTLNMSSGQRTVLETQVTAPVLTENGSGPTHGDIVLKTTPLNAPPLQPYGTADTIASTADQHISFNVTTLFTPPNTNVIRLLEVPVETTPGLLIVVPQILSQNNTANVVFPSPTRIVSVDFVGNTITVDNTTRCSIPEEIIIGVATDFTGEINNDMDYRADADPRFTFIRRETPRSFGYIAGYMTGDGTAPNGEPLKSGTAWPGNPAVGDYFLRLDYMPQKLFRWNGKIWIEISRNVRTVPGLISSDQSQLSGFINNTATVTNAQGDIVQSRQSLSTALKIRPD